MVEMPDPSFSVNRHHSTNPKPAKLTPSSGELPVSPTFKIPGLDFSPSLTKVQYKQFWSQLMNMVISQMKRDDSKMKQAMKEMKESFEGN